MHKNQYDRDSLYREVWANPVRTVAQQYGISDVGLKKICVKLGVPTPPLGYWARVAAGQIIPKPALPRLKSGEQSICSGLGGRLEMMTEDPDLIGPISETDYYIQREEDPDWSILVAADGLPPGELFADAKRLFLKEYTDAGAGSIPLGKRFCRNLTTSVTGIDRALRILGALAQALERRGGRLAYEAYDGYSHSRCELGTAYLELVGFRVSFVLSEVTETKQLPLTPAQERDNQRGLRYHPRREIQVGTGVVRLKIEPRWSSRTQVRCTFNDGKVQQVEHCLHDLMVSLWRTAEVEALDAWEERQKQIQEEDAKREAERQRSLVAAERERRRDFEKRVRKHLLVRDMRDFLATLPPS